MKDLKVDLLSTEQIDDRCNNSRILKIVFACEMRRSFEEITNQRNVTGGDIEGKRLADKIIDSVQNLNKTNKDISEINKINENLSDKIVQIQESKELVREGLRTMQGLCISMINNYKMGKDYDTADSFESIEKEVADLLKIL